MADLLKQVKKLALEEAKKIEEKEIYLSPKFKCHIQSLVDSVLIGRKKKPALTIDYNTDASAKVACTNGNDIYLNAGNRISNAYTLQENRMLALFGIVFHECAHILFHDFDNENKINDDLLKNGEFYVYSGFIEADETTTDEIIEAVSEEKTRPIFAKFYSKLSNCFSDVHDESKMCHKFHGVVERGITLSTEAMRSFSVSVEKMTEKYNKNPNPANALKVMMSLILQFARYGDFVIENDEEISTSNEFLIKMEELTNTIVIGCTTDDLEEKYTAINKCLLVLWPYIKEILDNTDSAGSSSSKPESEADDGGEDAIDKAVESILKSMDEATKSALPVKSEMPKALEAPSKSNPEEKESSDKGKAMDEKTAEDMAKNIIEGIKKEIAEKKAEECVEKNIKKSISETINSINLTSSHKGRPIQQIRKLDISKTDIDLYDSIMRELKPISKTLQRQMLNVLRNVKEEDVLKHRHFGSKLEARDTYRLDNRFFSKKKAPSNIRNMAIAVLVDLSGSMSGNRIESARKAAMLLYDFAKGLGIPIMVAGHTENYEDLKEFQYYRFAEFDSVNDKDKYRLSQIEEYSNNRDGMALQITSELLMKRPEETKLLIIISDGQPAADNYGGEAAIQDMQEIVRTYKRKGIETFAAAIGSDRDTIRSIYKDGYIDIDDLSKLPKALVKLLKKRII